MSLISSLVKNTTLNVLSYAYLLLLSFISLPMLVTGLKASYFATYLLLASLPSILSILDLGMSQASIQGLSSKEGKEKQGIKSNSYAFYLLTSICIFVIALVVIKVVLLLPAVSRITILFSTIIYLGLSIMINHLLTYFLNIAQGENRFDIYNLKSFIVGTSNTLVAGIIAKNGGGLDSIFLSLLMSYILTLTLVVYFLDKGASAKIRPKLDQRIIRPLLSYGLRNFIGKLSGQVELHSAKYILGTSLSTVAVSAYTIPQSIMYKVVGVVSQCALALFPLSSKLIDPAQRGKLRKVYYQIQFGLLAISLLGVLLAHLIGANFLIWWLGDNEISRLAIPVLKLLSYFFVLLSLTPIASTIVDSLGYPEYTSISAVLTSLLNLVLLFFLAPRYGAMGATYALLIAFSITTPLFLYLTERLLQSNKISY